MKHNYYVDKSCEVIEESEFSKCFVGYTSFEMPQESVLYLGHPEEYLLVNPCHELPLSDEQRTLLVAHYFQDRAPGDFSINGLSALINSPFATVKGWFAAQHLKECDAQMYQIHRCISIFHVEESRIHYRSIAQCIIGVIFLEKDIIFIPPFRIESYKYRSTSEDIAERVRRLMTIKAPLVSMISSPDDLGLQILASIIINRIWTFIHRVHPEESIDRFSRQCVSPYGVTTTLLNQRMVHELGIKVTYLDYSNILPEYSEPQQKRWKATSEGPSLLADIGRLESFCKAWHYHIAKLWNPNKDVKQSSPQLVNFIRRPWSYLANFRMTPLLSKSHIIAQIEKCRAKDVTSVAYIPYSTAKSHPGLRWGTS